MSRAQKIGRKYRKLNKFKTCGMKNGMELVKLDPEFLFNYTGDMNNSQVYYRPILQKLIDLFNYQELSQAYTVMATIDLDLKLAKGSAHYDNSELLGFIRGITDQVEENTKDCYPEKESNVRTVWKAVRNGLNCSLKIIFSCHGSIGISRDMLELITETQRYKLLTDIEMIRAAVISYECADRCHRKSLNYATRSGGFLFAQVAEIAQTFSTEGLKEIFGSTGSLNVRSIKSVEKEHPQDTSRDKVNRNVSKVPIAKRRNKTARISKKLRMDVVKGTIGKFIELSDEPECKRGFFIPILMRIKQILFYQRRSQEKTFVASLNMEFPMWKRHYQTRNDELRRSLGYIIKKIKKENPQLDCNIKVLCKVERNGTIFNYRVIFTCNADAFSSTKRLTQLLDYYWCQQFTDKYRREVKRYVTCTALDEKDTIITRANHLQLKPVFKWLSYVAKVDGTDGVKDIFYCSEF